MNTFRTDRYIAALPAQIFAAMGDAQRLARWWGPDGFSNRFDRFEFKPGGRWVFDMIGPDAKVYPNACEVMKIEPDRQVVIRHVNPPEFVLTLTLTPAGDGTQVDWLQVFADPSVVQAVAHIVRPANEQNLDRLERELGLRPSGPHRAGPDADRAPSGA